MPIYEYVCGKCGHSFEHLARTRSAPAPKCPKCDASGPEKQLSSFSAKIAGSKEAAPPCASGGACAGASCPYKNR